MSAALRSMALAGAVLLASAGLAEAGWLETLRERCPDKRLDWLNPGILVDGIEEFRSSLPEETQVRVEALAEHDLASCEAGAGCVNAAYIRALSTVGLTERLAKAICAMPYHCAAPFECRSGS